jgi:uncharacterized protein (TIGR03435 family)
VVLPDGRFEARGQSLANLARVAFGFDHVNPNQGVVQAATWMWNDRFDITASAGRPWTDQPSGTTVPNELRMLLRGLLEDRFALQARIATKKVSVIALQLATPDQVGPGLRPSAAACRGPFTDASPDETPPRPRCPFENSPDRIHAEAVTLLEAGQLLSLNRRSAMLFAQYGPVVDETGLAGLYDVSFSFSRATTLASLSPEIEAQLGLRLQGTSVLLPTLIIESAKKPKDD